MSEPYTPSTAEFREWVAFVDMQAGHRGESLARFHRWLSAHAAEVAAQAVATERAEWIEQLRALIESGAHDGGAES